MMIVKLNRPKILHLCFTDHNGKKSDYYFKVGDWSLAYIDKMGNIKEYKNKFHRFIMRLFTKEVDNAK